ncbi:glycosyltransferase [Candidatus Microgenomates bacterium]|nr:glycosyltransferase [Candidatus Microgenomates bacterium]
MKPGHKLKVVYATFSPWENGKRMPTNGMIEPMLKFFLPKTKKFILIDEPHPGSDVVLPVNEIYLNGKLTKKPKSSIFVSWLYPFLLLRNTAGTRIPFKVRDFLAVMDMSFRNRDKYDLFIGLESINALAGVILKKLGIVKTVIYYVSDYSPQRYGAKWFNNLYLKLDRMAITHSDYLWDVSLAMMPARIKAGLNPIYSKKVVHVPNAMYPEQINYLPINKTEPFSLMYAGTLGEENGPDIAIEAMVQVVDKYPKAKLHIYGGGDKDLKRLNSLTSKLNLKNNIVFHGFFTDQIKLSNEIKKYRVGLAPYKAIKGSPRWWADATKIRLYLAAGLPTITTQVPPLGKELIKEKAGLVTKDNAKETAKAISKLFSDPKLYSTFRANAINKAKDNLWENTYSNALKKSGVELS